MVVNLDHYEGEDVIITLEKEYDSGAGDSTTRTNAISNMEGKILSWNVSGGGQPTEDVFAFGGKTFNFAKPREKFTVSFEVMLNSSEFDFINFGAGGTETGSKNATVGTGRLGGTSSVSNLSGRLIKSTDASKRWRIIMWFQPSDKHVANSTRTVITPSKSNELYRMIFVDCKSVSFDKEFSADEYFKGTLNFEFSSSDDKGYANYIQEEGVATSTTSGPNALHVMTATTTSGIMLEARGYMDWSATTTPAWYAGSTTTDVTQRYRYTG